METYINILVWISKNGEFYYKLGIIPAAVLLCLWAGFNSEKIAKDPEPLLIPLALAAVLLWPIFSLLVLGYFIRWFWDHWGW